MNDNLKDRILRHLDALPDERGYEVLDYIEFLESKYAERARPDNVFTRLTEKVEDTMRAGKIPVDAISGTVNFLDGAQKVMRGVASAAQTVVSEASRTAQGLTSKDKSPAGAVPAEPPDDTPPAPPTPPSGPTGPG